jgi:hypothetical protein
MIAKNKKEPSLIELSDLLEARERLFELKAEQAQAREEELRIREYLAAKLHPGTEGSKTITVEGVKVTITRSLTRSIGIAEVERFCADHPALSATALRWKPELKISEYKKNVDVMDEYITTRAGLPTVEFN